MALPKGVRLVQLTARDWQVSWSEEHPATRWQVYFKPSKSKPEVDLGIIESSRAGARGHNRHTWFALTPKIVAATPFDSSPSVMSEGVYNRKNRSEAAQALLDAYRTKR